MLKQAFSALVPAFDPRPGRSNISQIQNFEVPPPGIIYSDCPGCAVLLCLVVCLTLIASFFLPSLISH